MKTLATNETDTIWVLRLQVLFFGQIHTTDYVVFATAKFRKSQSLHLANDN
jgi:hypothetical protein